MGVSATGRSSVLNIGLWDRLVYCVGADKLELCSQRAGLAELQNAELQNVQNCGPVAIHEEPLWRSRRSVELVYFEKEA
jgi:hypothetical protein